MFIERLLSGIVLIAIAIATLFLGGYVMFGVIMVISLIGMFELYRVMGLEKSMLAYTGYGAVIAIDCAVHFGKTEFLMPIIILALMIMLAVYVLTYPKFVSAQVTNALFGVIYVGLLLSYVCQVRNMENGKILVWLVFIGAWGSDTCAYCVGKLIGKHKLPSKLSPKKTIEGCVGGVVGAALLGALYAWIFKEQITVLENPVAGLAIVCGVSAVISQIGDLAASGIKRNYDIKDYGKLIPGHGGILDRFDSIIFIAPIVYYLLNWM